MFVLGLTLVFGLIVIDESLGVVPVTLGVDESVAPGVVTCAPAGPIPMTNAASDAVAIDAYRCFMLDPLRIVSGRGGWPPRGSTRGAAAMPLHVPGEELQPG